MLLLPLGIAADGARKRGSTLAGSGRSKAWPLLIVASVVRNVTRDRRQAGEPEPDTLQQYMEGNIIRRCGIVPEITEWGGERLASSSAMSPGCSCVPSRRRPD